MEWEVERLTDEILDLLVDGPATVAQLETATGKPAAEIQRALAGLFAEMAVEPAEGGWRLLRPSVPLTPR